MTTIIDFTNYRKNTLTKSNRYIAICPKCGKKGERTVYPAKSGVQESMFVHTAKQLPFAIEVISQCTIKNEVTAK